MKKANFMTAALLVVAVLLMAACTQTPVTETPATSTSSAPAASPSTGGALEDNTFFGDGNATSQPTSGATVPSSNVTTPSTNATVPSSTATQPTTTPTQPATQPTTQPTTPANPGAGMDYQTFQAMTGAEQRAFQESFESLDAFFAWFTAAKEAYEQANPPIEVGGNGVVTLPTTPAK